MYTLGIYFINSSRAASSLARFAVVGFFLRVRLVGACRLLRRFDQEPVLVAQEIRELLESPEDLDEVVADVPSKAELARRKKSDDRDHRVDARDQRLVPGQVGHGGVARAQVLQVLLAILPSIWRLWT